ncbi:MAG: dihydropteroate synthase [Treponema sp.]|nr:dihydropteroate synthase [Treponema sp.]
MIKKTQKLQLADRVIVSHSVAFVMGIVNVTPDSFWKNSRGDGERALQLIDEGADIIDVGGESSRPGAEYVSEEDEINRVIPVIQYIRRHSDCPISIDTRKKTVMKAAFEAGADILNDISALEDDPELASYAAQVKIPVILMHKRGIPATMQKNTGYTDVVKEVHDYLMQRASYACSQGIAENKIIFDPGIGFGKDIQANIELIKHCGSLGDGRYPVLMALSRKTCIGEMTGKPVEDRLYGTIAADLFAVMSGAFMIRVHDVAAAIDGLHVWGSLS